MAELLRKGRYVARTAQDADDLAACLSLRALCFRGGAISDKDSYDDLCTHVMVEETRGGVLVCCFRMLPLRAGADIRDSYAAQYYTLEGLASYPGKMVEMGRFCIAAGLRDPDILRVAWGAMTRYVDDTGVDMLFGCSSFEGTVAETYLDTFALLQARHLAPKRWLPQIKAPAVFRFADRLRRPPDMRAAQASMPPLLRTYLMMGGWVSDHAVVDTDLGTLHVFTGLEIATIPAARKRLLRAVTGGA
jgi:putative hemolysin